MVDSPWYGTSPRQDLENEDKAGGRFPVETVDLHAPALLGGHEL